jgi:hypothetical protein
LKGSPRVCLKIRDGHPSDEVSAQGDGDHGVRDIDALLGGKRHFVLITPFPIFDAADMRGETVSVTANGESFSAKSPTGALSHTGASSPGS